MKTFRSSMLFLLLAFFTANADPSEVDNSRVSVYLHPATLLIGANAKMLMLYSTIEKPFSLYNALIVKPSVWSHEFLFRAGSDIGLRHYPSGKGEGLYLQLQGGAFYFSAGEDWSWSDDWNDEKYESTKINSTWFDVMGYFGYSYKFTYLSIYSDTGLGYGCVLKVCSLLYDVNFGIGIAF